ncbi:hypothetical protein [Paractinoplanes atraurantiacus]|uniref:hypothetical protein n=1 Tax=Paractinoplanes atraurantiacus TaxID=1036182 RepID=UPI0011782CDC|nr:hypothetical protein [Actinoplanes atraurantiacus]
MSVETVVVLTAALNSVSDTILKLATILASRRWVLGLAVVAFTVAGTSCVVASGVLFETWWQAFFLEVGVGLLLTGIVDLAILGLISRLSDQASPGGTRPSIVIEAKGEFPSSLLEMARSKGQEVVVRIKP